MTRVLIADDEPLTARTLRLDPRARRHTDAEDRIAALGAGAGDCAGRPGTVTGQSGVRGTRPCGIGEPLARTRAAGRARAWPVVRFGGHVLDLEAETVTPPFHPAPARRRPPEILPADPGRPVGRRRPLPAMPAPMSVSSPRAARLGRPSAHGPGHNA